MKLVPTILHTCAGVVVRSSFLFLIKYYGSNDVKCISQLDVNRSVLDLDL